MNAKKKAPTLSEKSAVLLEELVIDAKNHGWQEDCGTGSKVDKAKKEFDASYAAMKKRLMYLEAQAKKYRALHKEHKPAVCSSVGTP